MSALRRLCRYPLCFAGLHVPPPPRNPHGPIVADCACCGKTCYFYGLSTYGLMTPLALSPVTLSAVGRLAR